MDAEQRNAKWTWNEILANTVVLYCFVASCSMAYFEWRYIKEHEFWDWMFLGHFISGGKALLWPYFLFFQ